MNRLADLSKVTTYVRSSGGSGIAGRVILGASIFAAFMGVSSYF